MKPLVIHHHPCPDGVTAAWVAWKHFNEQVDLFPTNYGNKEPEVHGREVYIVDFSYPRQKLIDMAKVAQKIVVLDHHKTAQADLAGLQDELRALYLDVTIIFDMNKSGAKLAWEYFNPGQEDPDIVRYCEDRDLWRWKLPASREINADISSYNFSVEIWDRLSRRTWEELREAGEAILRYQEKEIVEAAPHYLFAVLAGHKVPIINCTTKSLASELANRLAKGHPFAIVWNQISNGKFAYSLRSITGDKNPVGVDVSEVAKQFGGGGHANASGFILDYLVPCTPKESTI